jgi:hypothetical protein
LFFGLEGVVGIIAAAGLMATPAGVRTSTDTWTVADALQQTASLTHKLNENEHYCLFWLWASLADSRARETI